MAQQLSEKSFKNPIQIVSPDLSIAHLISIKENSAFILSEKTFDIGKQVNFDFNINLEDKILFNSICKTLTPIAEWNSNKQEDPDAKNLKIHYNTEKNTLWFQGYLDEKTTLLNNHEIHSHHITLNFEGLNFINSKGFIKLAQMLNQLNASIVYKNIPAFFLKPMLSSPEALPISCSIENFFETYRCPSCYKEEILNYTVKSLLNNPGAILKSIPCPCGDQLEPGTIGDFESETLFLIAEGSLQKTLSHILPLFTNLEDIKSQLQFLFKFSKMPQILFDEKGNLLITSPYAQKLFKNTEFEELIDKNDKSFFKAFKKLVLFKGFRLNLDNNIQNGRNIKIPTNNKKLIISYNFLGLSCTYKKEKLEEEYTETLAFLLNLEEYQKTEDDSEEEQPAEEVSKSKLVEIFCKHCTFFGSALLELNDTLLCPRCQNVAVDIAQLKFYQFVFINCDSKMIKKAQLYLKSEDSKINKEKRKHIRFNPKGIIVDFSSAPGKHLNYIHNISRKGLSLVSDRELEDHQEVFLKLKILNDDFFAEVLAKTIHVKDETEQGYGVYGLKILDYNPETSTRMDILMDKLVQRGYLGKELNLEPKFNFKKVLTISSLILLLLAATLMSFLPNNKNTVFPEYVSNAQIESLKQNDGVFKKLLKLKKMILNKSAFDENKKSFILNVIELENKSRQIEFLLKSKKVSGENAKRLFKSQIEINNFLKSLSAN